MIIAIIDKKKKKKRITTRRNDFTLTLLYFSQGAHAHELLFLTRFHSLAQRDGGWSVKRNTSHATPAMFLLLFVHSNDYKL